jgi:hypothetical protein
VNIVNVLPIKNEYRIFKPVENHHNKGIKVERSKIKGMNEFRLQYIYTWKCHNETPCKAILNKQKCNFFYKNREREGKTSPVWGAGTSGREEDIRKGCRRENVVEILCTYV